MPLRVVVVDDDPEARALARGSLEQAGMDVDEAADVAELLALLENMEPDAIVLDLTMPGQSGWNALNTIRAQQKREGLPIVIVTSHDDDQFRAAAKKAGVNFYITKPYRPWELVEAVERSGPASTRDPWASGR